IDGEAVIKRMFDLTDTMGAYRPSTMIDYVESRPMEINAIFSEPLRRAISLGVDTHRLALVTALMQAIDENRIANLD
ncbi:ketopantoate reductase C-terminal domain-containing protein, partial [Chloroflexota bacterium]